MNAPASPDLRAQFERLAPQHKMITALLAMAGEPMGRTRIHDHLDSAGIAGTEAQVGAGLEALRALGMVGELAHRGWVATPDIVWPALKAALDADQFHALASAYENLTPLRRNWEGFAILRSYRQGVALLRIALAGGQGPSAIAPLLAACMNCHEAGYLHPLVDICARPFEPELFARIHPGLRDEVLTVLIENAQREPASAPHLRSFAEAASSSPSQSCPAPPRWACAR